MPPPSKRTKLLSDDESGSDEDVSASGNNGASATQGFSINTEYARRFEHNKKRQEREELEEKYGKDFDDEEEEESSTSEEEDDDAELATADVDAEIMDTIQAIRNKDPRLYDTNVKFYKEFDPDAVESAVKEKPMYLQDYHRQNLLAGHAGADVEEEDEPAFTYQQEQDALRQQLVGSMHAKTDAGEDEASDGDEFLVKKSKQKHESLPTIARKKPKKITDDDIATAEKDPETYLSNFMAARAWLPTDGSSRFAPMDSDNSDDDERADAFEAAYNMRFEDPDTANAKLQSFSRDVGKYGVRREAESSRKKTRDREREKRDAAKREKEEQKARLRKLKIDEAEEKVAKIKEAAGLVGQDVDLSQWREIIDGDFDDAQWDTEMQQRFGDNYYASKEGSKVKKPKWDDDIDINDLVPDFGDDDDEIQLSEREELGGAADLSADDMEVDSENADKVMTKKSGSSKRDREKAKSDAKRAARKQRAQIESMIDESLATVPTASSSSNHDGIAFRYRATSPTTFGLTTRDILFADDKQLNEFAGLKKLAAFRDEEKKRRDKKRLSKKARLRQWRKDTFGNVDGPEIREDVAGPSEAADGEDSKKKKRRSKKRKAPAESSS